MKQEQTIDLTSVIVAQNQKIIGFLTQLVEYTRPKTDREVLQLIKQTSPGLFEELYEQKIRETDLGQVIQEYARMQGMTEDQFINHSEQVTKEILAEIDESRQKTIEENRAREARRAELLRQANEI